ncbi:MAG: hypothetical protein AAGG75_24995 [Bacteroidota bacterium]
MHHISENNIKKVTLRFLKTYYKFRPRVGETTFSQDLATDSGIIADGYMTFPTDKGGQFTATFEATSHNSRNEVIYKLQDKILFWDSLAVSFLFTVLLFSYGYANGLFTIDRMGLGGSLSLLGLVIVICYYAYQLSFRNLHRYRYIYAIEQFKRYHADEQWIAISTDIFDHPDDRYFKELKEQCVHNGIGLIAVDPDLEPHMLITPSREELFGSARKRLVFRQRSQAANKATDRLKGWWNKLVNGSTSSLLRYQRSHFLQIALCSISLVLLSGIYYDQLRDKSVAYVDEEQYEQEMLAARSKLKKEPKGYIVDSANMRMYRKLNVPYQSEEEPLAKEEEPAVGAYRRPGEAPVEPVDSEEIYVGNEEGSDFTGYECERFYNITGTVYIIQDNAYERFEAAEKRLQRLRAKGLECNALWLGCFTKKDKRYVVYYDMMFENRSEAAGVAKDYRRKLRRQKIDADKVLIRSISRIK